MSFMSRMFQEAQILRYQKGVTMPVQETNKVTQVNAGLKSAFSAARCSACSHFSSSSCSWVEGDIRPDDVCDLFEPKRGENLTGKLNREYLEATQRAANTQESEDKETKKSA